MHMFERLFYMDHVSDLGNQRALVLLKQDSIVASELTYVDKRNLFHI